MAGAERGSDREGVRRVLDDDVFSIDGDTVNENTNGSVKGDLVRLADTRTDHGKPARSPRGFSYAPNLQPA